LSNANRFLTAGYLLSGSGRKVRWFAQRLRIQAELDLMLSKIGSILAKHWQAKETQLSYDELG
jgi:hypothetical protein